MLNVKLLRPGAKLPVRSTLGAAAYDVFANLDTVVSLNPGAQFKVPLGFSVALPAGYGAFLIPRSGLGIEGLVLANGIGLIDSDYRGEVMACMKNTTVAGIFDIHDGMRVCQMVVMQIEEWPVVEVAELPETDRGDGGFGSTGTS